MNGSTNRFKVATKPWPSEHEAIGPTPDSVHWVSWHQQRPASSGVLPRLCGHVHQDPCRVKGVSLPKRKRYSPEYKHALVERVRRSKSSCRKIALEVGVSPAVLTRWVREADAGGTNAFPGGGTARDEQIARLRRDLSRVTKERDFLKDAAASFAQQSPNGTLMASAGLQGWPRRNKRAAPRRPTRRPEGVENRLEPAFTALEPETKWVTDLTEVQTHDGKRHLCAVLDLYSKRGMGGSMHPRPDRHMVVPAVPMAVWQREGSSGVILHPDRGGRFISGDYQKFPGGNALVCSMSCGRPLCRQCGLRGVLRGVKAGARPPAPLPHPRPGAGRCVRLPRAVPQPAHAS